MIKIYRVMPLIALSLLSFCNFSVSANPLHEARQLQRAYPEYIQNISRKHIIWYDGSIMPLSDGIRHKTTQEKLDFPSLFDQVHHVFYQTGIPTNPAHFNPSDDPGRIRYEPFFRKMYGETKAAVEANLVTIYWMPHCFGTRFPLRVTTINHVNEKFEQVSAELEALVIQHPEYKAYLENPSGTYQWRLIANTNRLSLHSFGMTIDLNANVTDYWQWQLKALNLPITEDAPLVYRNHIPWEIVPIFEKHGFIWGGKWHHFDSMHFEYRPELIIQ